MQKTLIYNYFDDDDFLRISNEISKMEKITAGEIRISIKEKKPFNSKKNLKELAEEEFNNLGMSETRDKTGILLFMLLSEKKFYILADSGINEKVDQKTWDEIRDKMQEFFKIGKFTEGVVFGINRVGTVLGEYFPIKPDDTNELSNKVVT